MILARPMVVGGGCGMMASLQSVTCRVKGQPGDPKEDEHCVHLWNEGNMRFPSVICTMLGIVSLNYGLSVRRFEYIAFLFEIKFLMF